jgi:hypothetical protein
VSEVSDDVARDVQVSAADLTKMVGDLQKIVNDSDTDIDLILTNLRYITDEIHEIVRMVKKSPGTLLTEPPKRSLSQ